MLVDTRQTIRIHKSGFICGLLPVFTLLAVAGWMAGTLLPLTSTRTVEFSMEFRWLAAGLPVPFTTHLFLFGILGFLTSLGALLVIRSKNPVIPALAALLIGGAWAVGTEWYQRVLPGRDASIEDLLVNGLGLAGGAMAAWLARRAIERLTQVVCRNQ